MMMPRTIDPDVRRLIEGFFHVAIRDFTRRGNGINPWVAVAEELAVIRTAWRAETEGDEGQIWVRAVTYHDNLDENAIYDCGEYMHSFTVEAFRGDPGEYSHDGGTPAQFRVKVPLKEHDDDPATE
jgi:hypothetical protein